MQFVGSRSIVRRLWDRTLERYPDNRQRYLILGIVVLATIVLYYEFYVPAAVTPSIIADFGITWPFFVYVIVVANLVGAFASLIAGLADRWGRSNLVTYGLLVTALVVLFGLPNAPNLWVYAVLYCSLGFVEGIIRRRPSSATSLPNSGEAWPRGSGRWVRSSPASPWRWSRATPSITSMRGRTSSSSAASSAWWCSSLR
jgi:hypothetical protein